MRGRGTLSKRLLGARVYQRMSLRVTVAMLLETHEAMEKPGFGAARPAGKPR